MSIRDLLLNILIAFGVAAFIFMISILDSIPFWILSILVVIVWVAYIVIVIRDHARDIRYPLLRVRPEKKFERVVKAPQTTPYDQEEDKE